MYAILGITALLGTKNTTIIETNTKSGIYVESFWNFTKNVYKNNIVI